MPTMNRRHLLAGTAAVAALSATPATMPVFAQTAPTDLSGKSILITGCSSGFGRLGALHFARAGARVIATMRNLPRPEADSLAAEAEAEDLDLRIVEIDVLSDEQVSAGVAEAERIAGGAIDILVNNAGIGITGPIELQDMEATQLMFDTNVLGYQRMARAVLPGMRAAGSGQIFAISSQLGRVIVPGAGQYSPTKFAVEAMFEQLAYELVPHNIDVTIIQPGGYPTRIWVNRNRYTAALRERTPEERRAAYPALVERMGTEDGSGRTADPADVPRAIAEIIAMPAGTRPLRRAVHPGPKPQEAINRVSAETQVAWLGDSGFGPWIRAVHH
ncbi:SDR family oxidoreductase [Parasphingopyxis lamellibrachiae]|uniref:NADP-dependent 3-hydroxy acid dehydrogenase YdfG n=1 Tax=Parasphingopyxis lamellibrachiae TaxID=680125 RepID=A0A3D9FDY0_9SPHN|nr:SDR family oxidoreductase [Parasphingopyxis lamellibrachiae]RED15251.1 NADP-dependent 3-hydroxy acid dehydrogenase YdfG [Parasphingopyxis lamellibrachiae]